MIREYGRLIFFTAGLLVGIQLPAFIEQYRLRIDAQLTEARENLSGFQRTADLFFDGQLKALIAHYRSSDDPVFNADAENVLAIFNRVQMLTREQTAMAAAWYRQASHVLFFAPDELRAGTLEAFSYSAPLNPQAIAWGIATGFILAILIEGSSRGCVWCGKRMGLSAYRRLTRKRVTV